MEEGKPKEKGAERKRSFLSLLLAGLLLLFVLSSGMVGYLLGQSASRGTGELIDTIVLSPGDTAKVGTSVNHFLSGKLTDPQGQPCGGVALRLGENRQDKTDEQGKFFFAGLQSGSHTLGVLDDEGNTLASAVLELDFSEESRAAIEAENSESTSLQIPENTRMLDLAFTVDGKALSINEGSSYLVTTDGAILNFSGGKLAVNREAVAVTSTGNVVTPEGYVFLPSRETVLTPPGGSQVVGEENQVVPGLEVQPDGSAKTESGVVVLTDNVVKKPDGETTEPQESVILIQGDEVEEITELPPIQEEPTGESPQEVPEKASGEEEVSAESAPESSGQTGEESLEEPTPVPEPTPGGIAVEDMSTGMEWSQQSMIDLFKNRSKSSQLGTENGVPIIAPGSEGYYNFRLKNNNDFDIVYTISIEEQSFHLPIGYSVVDAETNYYYMRMARTGEEEGLATSTITLPAHSTRDYRIDWVWQFEERHYKQTRREDNKLDTQAAMGDSVEDRTYVLNVSIDAAQVIPVEPDTPGVDTRYPGVH